MLRRAPERSHDVPSGEYDAPGATITVYLNALEDALATFEATKTNDAFPRLMRDPAQRGVDEGYAGKELTSLVEMLAGDATDQSRDCFL